MKKFAVLLAVLFAVAVPALADGPEVQYILSVRPELAASRPEMYRALWNAALDAAAQLGYRTEQEYDREDSFMGRGAAADYVMYEYELGEIKMPGDDADFKTYVRVNRADGSVISAELVWECDARPGVQERHEELFRVLSARTDLFLSAPAK